jgi:hypothetical protein
MRQARDSGWYTTEGGGEVFIAKGTVRPDNHPDVQAIPALFDQLSDDSSLPVQRKGTGGAKSKGPSDE